MVKRYVACYLVVAMFVIGTAPRLEAGFAPSEVLQSPSMRSGDLAKIQAVLENKLVSQRLQDLGFSPTEVATRLSQMSDEQIHRLALRLDEVKVGGELGVIIAVLIIVILVIVILQLSGHRAWAR